MVRVTVSDVKFGTGYVEISEGIGWKITQPEGYLCVVDNSQKTVAVFRDWLHVEKVK